MLLRQSFCSHFPWSVSRGRARSDIPTRVIRMRESPLMLYFDLRWKKRVLTSLLSPPPHCVRHVSTLSLPITCPVSFPGRRNCCSFLSCYLKVSLKYMPSIWLREIQGVLDLVISSAITSFWSNNFAFHWSLVAWWPLRKWKDKADTLKSIEQAAVDNNSGCGLPVVSHTTFWVRYWS